MKTFRANGKLLLSGEYTVLRGALALAVPTRFGQLLRVETTQHDMLLWQSFTVTNALWFSARFTADLTIVETTDTDKAEALKSLLQAAKQLNPFFDVRGVHARTTLEFHRLWGLGSSSTLVALVAQWAQVDALALFFASQKGSGYDVACALHNQPITYQLVAGQAHVEPVAFSAPKSADVGFVYLGEKQNSAREIDSFSTLPTTQMQIDTISDLTKALLVATDLARLEEIFMALEVCTGQILNRQPIQERLFASYPGVVKSLGAWGGDFILITRFSEHAQYFVERGYATCLSWQEMIG